MEERERTMLMSRFRRSMEERERELSIHNKDRAEDILIERFMRLLRGRRISEETYQILRLELEHNREYREYEKVELGSEAMKQQYMKQYMNHFNVDFDGSMWHNNSLTNPKKEPFISEKEMKL